MWPQAAVVACIRTLLQVRQHCFRFINNSHGQTQIGFKVCNDTCNYCSHSSSCHEEINCQHDTVVTVLTVVTVVTAAYPYLSYKMYHVTRMSWLQVLCGIALSPATESVVVAEACSKTPSGGTSPLACSPPTLPGVEALSTRMLLQE